MGNVYHLLCFKEIFLETVAQTLNHSFVLERHCLMFQLTAFETDQPVGQCVLLFMRNILLIILIRSARGITARLTTKSNSCFLLRHGHGGKLRFSVRLHWLLRLLRALSCRYCQPDEILFPETRLPEECRETSARTQVHNACAGTELDDFGNTQRMKYVMFV